MNGYSFMGDDDESHQYIISSSDCNIPTLSIDDIKDKFYEPKQVGIRNFNLLLLLISSGHSRKAFLFSHLFTAFMQL